MTLLRAVQPQEETPPVDSARRLSFGVSGRPLGLVMLSAGKALLLGACIAAGFAFSGMAQQQHPQEPLPALACDAFRKNDDGEWVATRNIMVPAPFGMVEIKAGQVVEEDLQERLDAQCK